MPRNCGVVEGEAEQATQLVLVDAALHRRHQHHVAADPGHPVQRPQLLGQDAWLPPQDLESALLETVELEVDGGADLGQLGQEAVVRGDALAIGVEHHVADIPTLGRAQHLGDLGMDAGLAARELHDLGPPFGAHQLVQDLLHLLQRQLEPGPGVGEAEGTVHVAGAVDLDDSEAGVLLVLGAEPAVVGAAPVYLGVEGERDGARLVEAGVADVGV